MDLLVREAERRLWARWYASKATEIRFPKTIWLLWKRYPKAFKTFS